MSGMGEIYVLDQDLDLAYVIDSYKSLIWSSRYVELGDCELYLPASPELLSVLSIGHYLMRTNDPMLCRIKKVELDTDAENGDYLIVTGKDAKDLCDQRIIWDTMTCDGNLETFIRSIVSSTMITPSDTARTMEKSDGTALVTLGTAAGFSEVVTEQVTYKGVGEKIRDYCTQMGWGYKMVLDGTALSFVLYKGTDRSASVVFSDEYENLDTTAYVEDDTDLANVALVGGEGEGSERTRSTSGYAEGVDRYEIFVDAKDVTQTVSWKELSTLYPPTSSGGYGSITQESGKYVYKMSQLDVPVVDDAQLAELQTGYPSGTEVTVGGVEYYRIPNVTVAELPEQTPTDTDNCTLRPILYDMYLLNRGYEKLAEHGEKITFSGTIEPAVTFLYKEDYFLGDIVTVQTSYGIEVAVRIVEVIEVDDEKGYSVQPKFQRVI